VVWAIWPQPWPDDFNFKMPGNWEEELADELIEVDVEEVPDAANGPPSSTACHCSGVAQPVTPALRSASAASESAMNASP
jgi:hypothetical protein